MPVYKNVNNNSWYIKTYIKDINGNSKQITKRDKTWIGRKGKELAQQEELRLRATTRSILYDDISFKELAKRYFKNYKEVNKANSYYKTLNRYKLHIENIYTNKKISMITKEDHKLWQEKINSTTQCNGKPLSTKYKNILHALVVSIFNYAIENYNLQNNPASITKRFKKRDDEISKQYDYWELDEFTELEKYTDNQMYKTLFSFFYLLGMRRGECLALTWHDGLNIIENKELLINKNCIQNINGKKYIITTPKSKSSIREISVPKIVSSELSKLYEQESNKSDFDLNWFIFGGIEPIPKTTLDNNLHKYTKKASLNYLPPHKLRHSFGSYLLQTSNGEITISDISKFLGHSSKEITMNVYLHVFKKEQNKISNYWDKIIKY